MRMKRPKLALEKEGVAEVEVPITAKQVAMIGQYEAQLTQLIQQRNTVLNALIAGTDLEGNVEFIGTRSKNGKHFIVVKPTA
jgi:hypothetical protein